MNFQINVNVADTAQYMVDNIEKSNPRLHAIAAALLESEHWQQAIDLIDYFNDLQQDKPVSPMMGLPKSQWDINELDKGA